MSTQAAASSLNASALSRRPRIFSPGAKFATIVVGKESDCFTVHEQLLTHYSGFFRAALTENFRESKEKRVVLSEDDPLIVEVFIYWLYHQRFPSEASKDDEELLKKWNVNDVPDSNHFVKLYIFSDKYAIKNLGKDAMDELWDGLVTKIGFEFPSFDTTNKAFECLDSDSPMCRFLVDAFCCYGEPGSFEDNEEDGSPLFIFYLCRHYARLYDAGPQQRCHELEICDFHDHRTQQERRACEKERLRKMCQCAKACDGDC